MLIVLDARNGKVHYFSYTLYPDLPPLTFAWVVDSQKGFLLIFIGFLLIFIGFLVSALFVILLIYGLRCEKTWPWGYKTFYAQLSWAWNLNWS